MLPSKTVFALSLLCFFPGCLTQVADSSVGEYGILNQNDLFQIEGKVLSHDGFPLSTHFKVDTKIVVNYGQYFGYLRPDGNFEVSNLPPGSYVVEVSNANYFYEPIRVDITSKGKIRARKVNYIQASEVKQVTYPLKFKAKAPFKYFQIRETWKVTDFIFNPMVLMMVLPLFFIMVLPKMMNPNDLNETQKELQNLPKMDELSEMMTNWLGNKPTTSQVKPTKSIKNKNK